jgi:hypothetical protein
MIRISSLRVLSYLFLFQPSSFKGKSNELLNTLRHKTWGKQKAFKFDDYLSLYIDRDYTVTNYFTNQLAFMDSLFENADTRDYVLKILAFVS